MDATEICAVKAQDRLIRPTVLLAIRSVTGNILDDEFIAGHKQRAVMRAVVCHSMVETVSHVLSKTTVLKRRPGCLCQNTSNKSRTLLRKEKIWPDREKHL